MFPIVQYIKYKFKSSHRHGFGIHSPYVYHLMTNIIEEDQPYYKYSLIEKIRSLFLKMDEKIGVFSPDGSKKLEPIDVVTREMSVSPKYGQLLFRLVNFFKPEAMVEYGTTTGISTMYMAAPDSRVPVHSLTMQTELDDLARNMCERYGIPNIIWHVSRGAESFIDLLEGPAKKADLLFINQASADDVHAICERMLSIPADDEKKLLVIVSDIHSRKSMQQEWDSLKAMPGVSLSIDLYKFGLLFHNADLQKEDYVLSF